MLQKANNRKQSFGKDANAHRINSARMKAIFNDLHVKENTNTEFYICGAKGLMEIATATLQEIGFSKDIIHKENFYSETKAKKTSSETHQIKILLKGKEHEVKVTDGKSILFAGLDFGLDMPFSCQSGNCISCAGKCLSGEVEMSETDGLTEEQIKNGYVLTCVGFPKSDDVVIEFN
jgi:ring-1,2-phenylacetyl-CoA epoxidase subunit PaaE